MNYKKANWAFFGMVLLHFIAVFVLSAVSGVYVPGIVGNIILSELMLVIPAAAALIFSKEKWKNVLSLHRMKFSSVLMVLLYTILLMPLTTLLNAISMLFVDNAVGAISTEMMEMPFLFSFFLVAIWGPVCEEFVFRGVIYRGQLRSGNTIGAILLSSLLFGLIHMNFNQAPYAFVLGIAMALVMEVTGTLLAPILVHVIFNGQSVIQMYAMEYLAPGMLEEQLQMEIGMDEMAITISVYVVLSLICTALAACVLVWLSKNEKRDDYLLWLFGQHRNRKQMRKNGMLESDAVGKLWSIPAAVGIVACLAFMLWTVVQQ